MKVAHENALYLSAEEKSFKNKAGEEIEYMKAFFLGDDNKVIECNVVQELRQEVLDAEPRSSCSIELEVTEEQGYSGAYLKKRLVAFSS